MYLEKMTGKAQWQAECIKRENGVVGGEGVGGVTNLENCVYLYKNPGYAPDD